MLIYNMDDPEFEDFHGQVSEWYGGVTSGQLTAWSAPFFYDTQGWADAYESWYDGLNPVDLDAGVYAASGGGGNSPPRPPA